MSRVLLLGNGFNNSLLNFVDDLQLNGYIRQVIGLWHALDERLGENFSELDLEKVYEAFDVLRMLKFLEKNKVYDSCFSALQNAVDSELANAIWDIVENFVELEINGFYIRLANYLNNELFEEFLPVQLAIDSGICIYTTNYDGIAEIVLAYDPNEEDERKRIKLPDMFGWCHEKYNCFSQSSFVRDYERSKLLHLHGSYKFYYYDRLSVKLKRDYINEFRDFEEPIIILNAPSLKKRQIMRYPVLDAYFYSFQLDLKRFNSLVIWGQSLRTDPHILEAIRKSLNDKRKEVEKEGGRFKFEIVVINLEDELENIVQLIKQKLGSDLSEKVRFNPINANERAFTDLLRAALNP